MKKQYTRREVLEIITLIVMMMALFLTIGARVRDEPTPAQPLTETAAPTQEPERAAEPAPAATTVPEASAGADAETALEAEAMARVLYGTAQYHSREAQAAVCWCIINRAESELYPDTIQEVCAQNDQWMGYSADNPVVLGLYAVALEVLTTWHEGGYRMVSPDFLFLSWDRDEIILRTTFEETARTHYWHAGGEE